MTSFLLLRGVDFAETSRHQDCSLPAAPSWRARTFLRGSRDQTGAQRGRKAAPSRRGRQTLLPRLSACVMHLCSVQAPTGSDQGPGQQPLEGTHAASLAASLFAVNKATHVLTGKTCFKPDLPLTALCLARPPHFSS